MGIRRKAVRGNRGDSMLSVVMTAMMMQTE